MSIKVIALDVDGTLMSSRNELLPSTIAALQDAADHGIHIVLSTGRMLSECRELLAQLPMIRYAVTCTGAQTVELEKRSGYYGEIRYFCDVVTGKTQNTKNSALSAATSLRLIEHIKQSADQKGAIVPFLAQ